MNNTIFISDALIRALGWTLVHSLWQGALAALVLLALLPRLQTARQRYWAAYATLSAVFVAAVATCAVLYAPMQRSAEAELAFEQAAPSATVFFVENQLFDATIWERATNWLESNYPLIVAVWLLGFGFFLLRLASGLWYVNRLTRHGISPLPSVWEEKMAALGERLGMSRTARLLESALVHTPVAIGWLKPVVLLPVGMVNRLSPAEVEAVLAHELAHIARRDWVFNLVQAFIETLFYYHPAVWWMSQVVRRERENCCDDAALAATGNPLAFAKALVQVQEMATPAPLPALALGMSGSRRLLLLERVRRILNQPQQKSQIMEKFVATAILLALLTLVGIRANNAPTLSAAFAQMTELPAVLFGMQEAEQTFENDSLPKPRNTRKIVREDDNQRVEAEYQDGKLTRLNIDGKEVPASEFAAHQALTEELKSDIAPPRRPHWPDAPRVIWNDAHGGFWEIHAPAAPIAPVAPMAPMAPMAPIAPFAPSRIHTEKDGDGNTIIVLERGEKPMEIKVKDGQVWVDGEELEEGEPLDLPGFENGFYYWDGGDNTYHFTPKQGFLFEKLEGLEGLEALEGLRYLENLDDFPHFKLSDEEKARLEAELARMRDEATRIQDEHRYLLRERVRISQEDKARLKKELKERVRISEEDRKRLEKELKERQKEWEKEQKQWAKEQEQWAKENEQWAKEQERWAKEQNKWALEQERWAVEQARTNAFGKALKEQLLRDGLIKDPSNFQIQLSEKTFKVNGEKQPDELRRKYLEFYREKTGKKLDDNGSFFWTENN